MVFRFAFVFFLFYSFTCFGDEAYIPVFNKLSFEFDLSGVNGSTKFFIKINDKKKIDFVQAVLGNKKIYIKSKIFSRYDLIDLNRLEIFVDSKHNYKQQNNGFYSAEYLGEVENTEEGFVVCIPYGELKKYKKFGELRWATSILELRFSLSGYESRRLDVGDRGLPVSSCTVSL